MLWLWHRPVATAPIQALAWEPPYAARAAEEIAKRPKKPPKKQKQKPCLCPVDKMEYYSAIKKNKIMPSAATWMELESLILSEVSQKEKEKYYMIYHLYLESNIGHK